MKEKHDIIDFHAHILPGADHGSKDPETSEKQLSLLRAAGISAVVAAPHFYPQSDNVESFLKRRKRSAEALAGVMNEDSPRVYLGAEVLVCPGIDHMPGLERLCIEGTNVLLLEMPFGGWREEHIDAVGKISRMGFTVVMAHIDRYSEKDSSRLLSEWDVLCQLNGESAASIKGRRRLDRIAESFPVCAVGSDIHGADKRAAKNLVRLYDRLEKRGLNIGDLSDQLLESAKHI